MPVPAYEEYDRVMSFLELPDPRAKDLKKKIFGENIVIHSDDRYNHLGMLAALQISPATWREYTIRDRAMIKARYYLNNMIEVVEAYNEETDRTLEKYKKKGGS